MIDCSTQAMEPKEPPETCGICYWMMMQPGHGECGACGKPICGIEKWPEAYVNGYYLYTTVDGDCKGEFWEPRTYAPARKNGKALEQRYQQLEEVAKELYKAIAPMHEHCNEDTCQSLCDMGWPCDICCHYFRDKLIELGVGIDG